MNKKKIYGMLMSLLLICTLVSAQKPDLQKAVRLAKHEWPLDQLLVQVTNQTGIRFSINTRKFPAARKLHIKTLHQTLSRLLEEIRRTTGIAYTQIGTHIVLLDQLPAMKRKSGAVQVTSKQQKPLTVTPGKEPALNATQVTSSMIPAATFPGPANTIAVEAIKKSKVKKLLNKKIYQKILTPTAAGGRSKRSRKEFDSYKGWFSKVGTTADDLLYLHHTLMIGHTFAYGIIGYSSDFRRGGLRYGIGSSFSINPRWDIHLQLSTAKLNFKYDSGYAVTKTINTSWHQLALKMEYKITEQIRLQFGPVYNLLKSKTNIFKPTDHFNLTPFELTMLKNHLNPFYTIKDEIGYRAGTLTKSWIGLQAGIHWNLNFSSSR